MGITSDWSEALRMENPVRVHIISQNVAYTREQKQAVLLDNQAPAILNSDLLAIAELLRRRLEDTADPLTRVILA